MKEAITAAAAAVCGRGEAATAAAPSSQALAGSSSLRGPVRPRFRTQVLAVVLASEPARWEATRRTSLRLARAAELVGCLERRLLPPLQILQWGCGRVAAPAALQPLPVPKARRRYTNLTVWLPPHVRSAASSASPPPRSPLRRRRLRRLRRLGRHQLSPPLPHTAAAARRCTRLAPVPTILQTAAAR